MVTIRTWAEAHAYLGPKSDRPLTGRATRIQRRDNNEIAIHYQNTDVVTYRLNGTCVLNSDGWQTVTTKERMNTYSPATVYQTKSRWYVGRDWQGQVKSAYYDGMVIDAYGEAVEPREANEIARDRIDHQVSKYIREYIAELVAGSIDNPDNGDCWGCRFGVDDNSHPMGFGHYLEHFTEPYYVPSILYRAVLAQGLGDPSYALHLVFVRHDKGYAARVLRAYFKKIKPNLYAEVTIPQAA